MKFETKKAVRKLVYVKIALIGASGSGKTYTSLRLATGMQQELKNIGVDTRILMGNTEQSRGYYYADEFDYDIVDIPVDANPEDYVEFINYAINENYKIVILDSASHEWKQALKIHQANGGDFKAFAKVTPRHEKFVSAIADSPLHVIANIRGEDKYEVEKNDNGKTTVKKLGVGGEARKDMEFEFTMSFLIDQKTNAAESQKDNTHLFESVGAVVLTEQDGRNIIKWANSGESYFKPVRNTESEAETLATIQNEAVAHCKRLGGSGNSDLMEVLKSFDPSCNPKKVKDIEKLKELVKKLELMKPQEEEKEN